MFLIPLRVEPQLKFISVPIIAVAIIAGCIGVYIWQSNLSETAYIAVVKSLGIIPTAFHGDFLRPTFPFAVPKELTFLTSVFLHSTWFHVGVNMLYLWVFGRAVEDATGHYRFLILFLACGIAGSLGYVLADPGSHIPAIGASGAVSGVLGAYLVLHPRSHTLWFMLAPWDVLAMRAGAAPRPLILLPAAIALGFWVVLQIIGAWIGGTSVAWSAHIAGFIAGAFSIVPLRRPSVALLASRPLVPLKQARTEKFTEIVSSAERGLLILCLALSIAAAAWGIYYRSVAAVVYGLPFTAVFSLSIILHKRGRRRHQYYVEQRRDNADTLKYGSEQQPADYSPRLDE